jgi:hypothetical protein
MWEFKHNFRWIHDSKRKGCQLQCCINFRYLQLLFWSLFHPRYLTTTTHSLVTIEHMDSFSINFYEILWNQYISIKTILNKKQLWTTKLHNLLRSTTFILVVFPSKILLYYYTLTYDFSIWNLAQGWMWTIFNGDTGTWRHRAWPSVTLGTKPDTRTLNPKYPDPDPKYPNPH